MHLEFRYIFSLYIPSHGAKIKDVHGLSDWKQIGKKKRPKRYKQSANFQIEQMARTVWLQEIKFENKEMTSFFDAERQALRAALSCLVDGTWD